MSYSSTCMQCTIIPLSFIGALIGGNPLLSSALWENFYHPCENSHTGHWIKNIITIYIIYWVCGHIIFTCSDSTNVPYLIWHKTVYGCVLKSYFDSTYLRQNVYTQYLIIPPNVIYMSCVMYPLIDKFCRSVGHIDKGTRSVSDGEITWSETQLPDESPCTQTRCQNSDSHTASFT